MTDLGVADTMMDYHALLDGDEMEEFGVEYFRFTQALQEAGIDLHMLSAMDRSRICKALFTDNTLFEDGRINPLFLGHQTYALLDAMHVTEAEREQLEEGWSKLTDEQKAAIGQDWAERRKNIGAMYAEMEELRLRGSLGDQDRAVAHFEALTPLRFGRVSPQYYLARQHLVEQQASLQQMVDKDLSAELAMIMTGFSANANSIEVPHVSTSFTGKPAGFDSWADKVAAERAPQSVQQELPEGLAAAPQTHVEQLERQRLLDELNPKELQAN